MAHSAGSNVRDCILFVLVWRDAHDEFHSLRLFNSRQRASSFLVANLNRRRFAAYRKRDEKSQRRDDQTGNLPFINYVTGSGRE